MSSIQFYFEFASPYSYIASLEIEELAGAAGHEVEWQPIELDAVWTAHGVLESYTAIRRLKRTYIALDAMRCATARGVLMIAPSTPARDTSMAKLAYWGLRSQEPQLAKRFLQGVWHRYFGEGKPISGLNDLAQSAAHIGLDAHAIHAAAAWVGARSAQDASNSAAVASGCFGVPWFVADGEPFFGQDRLSHLAARINARSLPVAP